MSMQPTDGEATDRFGLRGLRPTAGADAACGSGCEQALERLEAYLDGELPNTDVADIASHLSDCYPCTDRATFEEQLRAIVARDCVEDAPASLVDRIRTHLSELPSS